VPLSGRNGKGSDLTRLSKQGCPRFAPVLWALTWDPTYCESTELPARAVLAWLMRRTREETLQGRRQLKAEYRQLFDSVSALLFRHDPMGIALRQREY